MLRGPAAENHAGSITNARYVNCLMVQLHVLGVALDQLATGTAVVPSGIHPAHLLLQKGPSPINLPTLVNWLLSYPDKQPDILQDEFKFGFRIPVQDSQGGYYNK